MGYRLLLAGLLIMDLGYVAAARRIAMDPWTADELVNAQTLPTLYGTVLALLLTWMLFRTRPETIAPSRYRLLRVAGIILAALGFTAGLAFVNLWVALTGLLLVCAWWLGERRWLPLLGLALLVPLAGFLGVELLLGVYLPD
jgi:hypothetical protein